MEITRQMKVPAEYIYKQIMDSVIHDIRQNTGKTVPRQRLDQYEYIKDFGKNNRAKIKIDKAEENRAYHFTTSTTKNQFVVQYDIEPLTETTCQVTYRESMTSYGFMQKLNDMAVGILLGYFRKRRFKKMLEMMEEGY
ncbi:DUF3284 domain-containing protein [Vagococcus lutrae]|uniref:DUF3284 domain-containing protein n=1 Tax=Vagococcus lutrae TaxID=81947 RepID=A0AAE9XIL9_9ENTE|nr:DUF3284 domain-containing protein [Vagococcus lutrae]MDO5741581.1 DUF3284 domain-containing protein [Vagococcus sp.]MCO7150850.1 DUF3284 domain-containing protein [Vagococcus lutrae]MDT2802202.1 DUF3284 domain-containing protein [Vagococcus lutrae]MDT2805903.1 DUF3284 domain-containing protein [Vagococcus lutrae]MDT2811575.1 DUF3284 domain-containing protein [Vagococcus lutrae]